ncbi:MAG: hypothetical protein Q4C74_00855 [Rothia sp. (in: high G+C Gram-positive bacteria)]|nr:hypothetical protein [Rothia sp. (in: high G+C Gram-positive bacteria)]
MPARRKLGYFFLCLTLLGLVLALRDGGFYWLLVTLASALTLWATGSGRDSAQK